MPIEFTTDTELIAAIKDGQRQAVQQLIDTHKNRIYNTILGMVQNIEDAEELAHDVFIKALQTLESFKGDAQIGTWLYRIAINASLDHLKKKTRKKRFGFMVSINADAEEQQQPQLPHFIHPAWQLENKELGANLFKAINQLAENQKTVIILTKVEGLSYEQAAQVMQTSIAAIESLLFRARQNLKKIMVNYLKK